MAKNYTKEEQVALCAQWRESGVTQAEFCKKNGISKKSLYRWLYNKSQANKFIPLSLPDVGAGSADIEIVANNMAIKIPAAAGVSFVSCIIKELNQCK